MNADEKHLVFIGVNRRSSAAICFFLTFLGSECRECEGRGGPGRLCYAERRMVTNRISTRRFNAAPILRSIPNEWPS
jgi:hypothetical protein